MNARAGSVFTGSGMLDVAVHEVLGAQPAWFVENDPAASRVLAHRWHTVPNYGDITTVDWASVAPIQVLTGGFPCTDVSSAGKRAGLRPGTRSGLWSQMAYAISQLRPELVVIENVRGLLSSDAHCDLEPCPWCLGDNEGRPLRALGAVLGDLASLGYDAQWHGLPASDVGACHGRFRVFICAWSAANTGVNRLERRPWPLEQQRLPHAVSGGGECAPDPDRIGPVRTGGTRGRWSGLADHGESLTDPECVGWREGWSGPAGFVEGSDAAQCGDAVADADLAGRRAGSGLGRSVGQATVGDGAPAAAHLHCDAVRVQPESVTGSCDAPVTGRLDAPVWGTYEPAIRRWERVLGRPAPAPTQTGQRSGQQLSPAFTEWMMGWPQGWVTSVPGLSRSDQLKICGNGVVPQQAAAALEHMLAAVPGVCGVITTEEAR